MAEIRGYIEKIKFRNEDNGYSVLSVSGADDGEEWILVGTFSYVSEGEFIEAEGSLTEHPVYGEQLSVERYELKNPETADAVERYLASGAISGIGKALAARIVKKFKMDTLRIMEEEPERLAEIKGISERMALLIGAQVEEKKDLRDAMIFLQDYGISVNLAAKIYNEYGPALYTVLKKNPYRLAEDIPGVGFRMADEIASRAGIVADSDFRVQSGILYTLLEAGAAGHTCLPEGMLLDRASALLGVERELPAAKLQNLQMEKKIIVVPRGDEKYIYASSFYYMELNTARMLHNLNIRGHEPEERILANLAQIQETEEIRLDEQQARAVVSAVNTGLLVLTGGPGTGKTTTINTLIRYFERGTMSILLAAPTGRAAKRMSEATGHEARTIHRLLEISGMPEDGHDTRGGGFHFEKNEENPLDADVVIIDEMSMVDIQLMYSLLKAITPGTRLILVGDVDQLPSVGPGNVLRDIIDSGCFPVVRLTRIFRQAAQSDIILNAHRINRGEEVDLSKKSRDFLFIRRDDSNAIINCMITLLREKLPKYVNAEVFDIQVLTPSRKGPLGVERLNLILQEFLNPPSPGKKEKEYGFGLFREGDKVMQIKNNYQLEWETVNRFGLSEERGSGIFNGDLGIIKEISDFAETMLVEFDEGRRVTYSFRQLDELELAYAVTIHKSQGSEYPAVVIPMAPGHKLLLSRNLLYTAVTRARICVCLVGMEDIFHKMEENAEVQKRYSGLKDRLLELRA